MNIAHNTKGFNMKQLGLEVAHSRMLSHRHFVQGLAVGGVMASVSNLLHANKQGQQTQLGTAPELSGKIIELEIAQLPVNFTGGSRLATTINGSIPPFTLRLRYINGSSNTFYDVRIRDLKMSVVQADGQNVKPAMLSLSRNNRLIPCLCKVWIVPPQYRNLIP
jgi:FtsP/CotA-like multicopper oxidase with cupredoxin domain